MAGAVEVGHHGDVGSQINVGVGANNQRRFAAQFHGDIFQARCGGLRHYFFAGGHAAGEGDFGNIGVLTQRRSHTVIAQHHVEHTIRQAGFGEDFRQLERAQGRDFAGFEHHGIAGGQRRRGFPHGNLNRIIPCADAAHHAQRLLAGVNKAALAQRNLAAFDGGGEAGIIFNHIGAGNDIHI